jgi:hypothetical protein
VKILRTYDLRLDEGDPLWPELVNLLQAGFWIEAPGPRSVRAFMRETLFFDDDYIEGSISTVFVDSQPVDDLDAALVGPGSRLALSASMPGLVGAVMRIKSPYASFRSAISYGSAAADGASASVVGSAAVAGASASAGRTAGGLAAGKSAGSAVGRTAGGLAAGKSAGSAVGGSAGGLAAEKPAGGLVFVKLFNAVMAERGPALLERGLLVAASELAPLASRLGSGLGVAQARAEGSAAAPPPQSGRASAMSAAGASSESSAVPQAADGPPVELAILRVRAAARQMKAAGIGEGESK